MAEIGLVASIFGVASFGTKVATGLYKAADIMIHAHQQIASMAKHVSQFTAVLRHLGRVLEAEKGKCSDELLQEIWKIRRSSKATFKEIRATTKSSRFRSLVPVRWLFKRAKAKELEARLDSEQSMLQVMIHTVTVSKLGDMQSKSQEDSKQLLGLREEIETLKTLIIENHNNVTELQYAERRAQAETICDPSSQNDMVEGQPNDIRGPPPLEDLTSGEAPSSAGSTSSQDQNDEEDSGSSDEHSSATAANERTAVQPLSIHSRNMGPEQHRASSLLLQMVPYRQGTPNTAHPERWNRLISSGAGGATNMVTEAKPAMEEATDSVRLLLDKWTTSGSAPLSDLLIEDSSKDTRRDIENDRFRSRSPWQQPPSPPMRGSPDDEFIEDFDPIREEPFPHAPVAEVIPIRAAPIRTKEIWNPRSMRQHPSRYIGDDILRTLRYAGGGIIYSKGNAYWHSYYIDGSIFYRFDLAPSMLMPSKASEITYTQVGKGWVRQEALDLLGYRYQETKSGHWDIHDNLEFTEIEELVRLSYQAAAREMEPRSRQVISEFGWHQRIAALQKEVPHPPIPIPSWQASRSQHQRRRSFERRRPNLSRHSYEILTDSDFEDIHETPNSTRREHPPWPVPRSLHHTGSEIPSKGIKNPQQEKLAKSELRFSLPRLNNTSSTAGAQQASDEKSDPIITIGPDLQQALHKLELLKKKKDAAVKAKDTNTATDIEYYAIPEVEKRIAELEKKDQGGAENKAPVEREARGPRTEVETDSESDQD